MLSGSSSTVLSRSTIVPGEEESELWSNLRGLCSVSFGYSSLSSSCRWPSSSEWPHTPPESGTPAPCTSAATPVLESSQGKSDAF